jgi:hypothetical protein
MPNLTLTGCEVTRLMRQNRVTIRELAARTGFTMKRIRQVRRAGLFGPAVLDWQEAITGQFTARMRAQLQQWIAANLS